MPVNFVVDENLGQRKLLIDASERVSDQRAFKHRANSVDLLAADLLQASGLLKLQGEVLVSWPAIGLLVRLSGIKFVVSLVDQTGL